MDLPQAWKRVEIEKPSSLAGNDPFTITARLDDDGTAISGANVQASLIDAMGTTNITLLESTQGVYATEMSAPPDAGQYQLIVRARGASFARQDDLRIEVRPNDVQRNGSATVQALDTNNNGVYEALRVNVPLIVNRAAPYVAAASLHAPNGDEITSSRVEVSFSDGMRLSEVLCGQG